MPTNKISCKCCKQFFEAHLMVTCCVCKDKFKNTCVDITANEVRTLNSNKGYDWTCIDCRVLGNDLKDLKALIISLQNDIKELKARNTESDKANEYDFEEILQEIADRQKRKNNIILFNVPEQDQSKPVNEQLLTENNQVMNIVKHVNPDVQLREVKSIRLGAYSPNKIRPIKLKLENENTVRQILSNSKKIRSNAAFKKVYFSSDKTKKQIEHYKKIKQELTDRLNAGESNCRIKYVNNVPRIVTEN